MSPIEFWEHVDASGDCWEWVGTLSHGYGAAWIEGVHVLTHRYAYQTLVGPIRQGLDLDHLCRNRTCLNPDHLEPVTKAMNVMRGYGFGARHSRKTACVHGHPFDEANTYFIRGGGRMCRACHARREGARRAVKPQDYDPVYAAQYYVDHREEILARDHVRYLAQRAKTDNERASTKGFGG
jgi:hypothetical protein